MNWKEQIRDWWYKYHDGGYEMPEQMRVDIERIFKHSQQQLLESLEEEVEKMKSTNIEPHSHGGWSDGSYCMECETVRDNERTNDTLDEVKALIQSKKNNL